MKRIYYIALLILILSAGVYYMYNSSTRQSPPRVDLAPEEELQRETSFFIGKPLADVKDLPGNGSELVTQAFLGDPVIILQEKDSWVYGKVPDGYAGWIHKKYIIQDVYPEYQNIGLVKVPRAWLHSEAGISSPVVGEVLLGTDLPVIKEKNGWVEVWLPGQKTAWIDRKSVEIWPGELAFKRRGPDVVSTAEQLLGTPYLWGGMSLYGIDCSGLTYVSYYINGIKLPRDADMQFEVGREITKEELEPGDLVFFNTVDYGPVPTHVGIYLSEEKFLNSRSRLGVVVSRFDEPEMAKGYLGARRYLP